MRTWTNRRALGFAAALAALLPASRLHAQAPAAAPAPGGVAAINAEFDRALLDLERGRLERLAKLAATQPAAEADETYQQYFRNAIISNLYREAEPTAEAVLKSGKASAQVRYLANLANILAEADRGAYQESLDSIVAAMRSRDEDAPAAASALPTATRVSLIDLYYQKLAQAGQYDIARKAMTLIRGAAVDPRVKDLAASRLRQLDLLGKPAPAIVGKDMDGQAVSLADRQGKVVLVVFWASWCVPNAQQAAAFTQLYDQYHPRGLEVVGVNLDTASDGGQDATTVMPNIRRFLLDHNIAWPNVINGPGDQDYARAYAVTEIPANVLIGRDGRVAQLDLTPASLEKAVTRALAPAE